MNTTTHISLLRHGDTVGGTCFRGSTDDPLSTLGWAQMKAAVVKTEIVKTAIVKSTIVKADTVNDADNKIADINEPAWNRIISSPLSRCADFASALHQQNDIPLKLDASIREIHFGMWEGKTAAEVMQKDADALTNFWQDPTQYTPPEGEPLKSFNTRVISFWQKLIVAHPGEKVLLITHGGVIRILLCYILQHPLQRLLELEVGHASIHRIRIEHRQQNTIASLVATGT